MSKIARLAAVALFLVLAAGTADATLTWQPGDIASALGDSITAGTAGFGYWYTDNYQPTVNAAYTKAGVVVTTSIATAVTTKATGAVSTGVKLGPGTTARRRFSTRASVETPSA